MGSVADPKLGFLSMRIQNLDIGLNAYMNILEAWMSFKL
jgi:hypothetical protein